MKNWAWLIAFIALAVATVSVSSAQAKPASARADSPAQAAAADEFENIKCGGDIPKAVIGQRSVNGPVEATEKKYRAIGLKDLGGDQISDRLSSVNWLICGAEYIFLIDHGIVRDALAFPIHSKTSPAFSGTCQYNGKDLPGIYVAVLDGMKRDDLLPVRLAWKIDQQHAKFVQVPSEGIACPRSGIPTADGGR